VRSIDRQYNLMMALISVSHVRLSFQRARLMTREARRPLGAWCPSNVALAAPEKSSPNDNTGQRDLAL